MPDAPNQSEGLDPPRDILMLMNNFPPTRGGSAVVYSNLARHLGQRVTVVAPQSSYRDGLPQIGWREHDRHAPYRVQRLRLLRTPLASEQLRRAGWLRLLFSDLVIRAHVLAMLAGHVLSGTARIVVLGELLASSWIIGLCRFIPGVRTIVYVHGEELTTKDGYDDKHRRARRALIAADAVVVVSRFTDGTVKRLMGKAAKPGSIHLIENGVDTTRFRALVRRPDLVQLYGLTPGRVLVSVCRLLEKKGIDKAIEAFATVVQDDAGLRYLVVGSGPYAERLREIAAECGVADRVVFAGDINESELVDHYCLGDIFVMPNRELPNGDTEGFGLVFLEANSCGLPVIAGRDGGSMDAVQDGVNGLVVDGSSVSAIAAAMRSLLGDKALTERLREGAARVSRAADWQRKAEQFLSVCQQLQPRKR